MPRSARPDALPAGSTLAENVHQEGPVELVLAVVEGAGIGAVPPVFTLVDVPFG
ncbi:MAG: hypothetical protein M0032_06815 [Actinomycetota bacterium]|nr:hypothetical protein [Actinomycetota bacterium]